MKKLLLILIITLPLTGCFTSDEEYKEYAAKYKKGCDLDYGMSCHNLGDMYWLGHGVKQNDFKAMELYQKSCDLRYADGCFSLGLMYEEGFGIKNSD